MKEPKMCCNCLHCARWKKKAGIECHCDLTDKYLGYLDVMDEDNNCKHWEKNTKWDLQKKHDSELLDKVADRIDKSLTDDDSIYKEISSEWNKGTFMGCVLSVIAEMKAEVQKGEEAWIKKK